MSSLVQSQLLTLTSRHTCQ